VRFEEACEALTARSLAVTGAAEGEPAGVTYLPEGPEETARKILLGLLADDDVDPALDALTNIATNALLLLGSCPPQLAFAAMYGVMAQQLALGLLAGRGS
jgi:hypothetical protein